ncbi:DUF5753 domain-containing protein [Streptomyces scopuliridis]|uniref:DUF5753 domain-containing protein n=1 Tax=Streptomyces scopuliridis TaxID=452529 RepID=UPI0036CD5EB0
MQTKEYAYQAIVGMQPELKPAEVRGLVDVRMDCQQKVFGDGGELHRLQVLLEQGALRRKVGSDEQVRRGQLERLLDASAQDKICIRVLPDSVGSHPGLAGPFVLMGFHEAARDVVWCELAKRSVYFDQAGDVDYYAEVYTDLWERALNPADTRVLIKEMIKEKQ